MFFWSTLLGNIPVVLMFFFLAGIGFQYSRLTGWILPLAFVALFSVPIMIRLNRKLNRNSHLS